MSNNYETTIIVTPVLPEEEVKNTVNSYVDFLKKNGGEIVEIDTWGLRQLAYPIKKKTTGFYHVIEFVADSQLIDKLELSYRRDENILRFLTVKLDKYAVKYNDDKRKGLVGRNKKKTAESETEKQEA
jgi:small subunit ribosomal protein S6